MPLATMALVAAGVFQAAAPSQAAATTCHGHTATIVGTSGRDTIEGTPADDVIVGLGLRDHIDGNGGNDIICGGRGGDVVLGGPGDDQLFGGLSGKRGDYLDGGDDNDLAVSHGLEAMFHGGPGNDRLVSSGHPNSVRFWGDAGDDTMVTRNPARDEFDLYYDDAPRAVTVDLSQGTVAGWGQDRLRFSNGSRVIWVDGSPHDDTLIGTDGPDGLDGEAGNDTFQGLAGDDDIIGRDGTDVADAGGGDDRCISIEQATSCEVLNP
jgi:Ca2+-binding RTX toxin-like protein